MSRPDILTLTLSEIEIGANRRQLNDDAVKRLSQSIKEIGLRQPISVRSVDGRFRLIAGRHRIEATRLLGGETISAFVFKDNDIDARLWEISENLHRTDYTVQERSDQIAEYAILVKEKREILSAQVAQKAPHRPEGGASAAARDLGLTRDEVRRAERVASLSDEAKDVARECGFDDNQSVLLAAATAAKTGSSDAQYLRDEAERRESHRSRIDGDVKQRAALAIAEWIAERGNGSDLDAIKANLFAAGATNIANELTNLLGQSVMDRRYGSAA